MIDVVVACARAGFTITISLLGASLAPSGADSEPATAMSESQASDCAPPRVRRRPPDRPTRSALVTDNLSVWATSNQFEYQSASQSHCGSIPLIGIAMRMNTKQPTESSWATVASSGAPKDYAKMTCKRWVPPRASASLNSAVGRHNAQGGQPNAVPPQSVSMSRCANFNTADGSIKTTASRFRLFVPARPNCRFGMNPLTSCSPHSAHFNSLPTPRAFAMRSLECFLRADA